MSVARRVVLDASALLGWVLNERGADTISTLLPVAVIPAPDFVEVLHRAPQRGHWMTAEELGEHMTWWLAQCSGWGGQARTPAT